MRQRDREGEGGDKGEATRDSKSSVSEGQVEERGNCDATRDRVRVACARERERERERD